MATYQELLPQILPEVPGCPQTIVLQKLSDTVRHFCRESWFWQANIDPVSLLPFNKSFPDSAVYTLNAANGVEVLGIIELYYQGQALNSGVESAMNRYCPGWQSETGQHPRMYLPFTTPIDIFLKLSNRSGLTFRIVHYPSYCSKYNPIEHLVFPHLTRACSGVPLEAVETAKYYMEKTQTTTGLKVTVKIIDKVCETGRKYAADFKEKMSIQSDKFLPKWNYIVVPETG